MALTIQFGSWTSSPTQASVSWQVQDLQADGIAQVEVAIAKEGDPFVYTVAPGANGTLTLPTDQYQGDVIASVRATDFSAQTVTGESSVTVDNFVAPLPATWLRYENPQPFSLRFEWDALALSPANAAWRIVNLKRDNTEVVLAEVPVADRTALVATPLVDLYQVRIYGVDAYGNLSAPSPTLHFALGGDGPGITLQPWVISSNAALIRWVARSDQFITAVNWRLEDDRGMVLTGTGLPIGEASIPVDGYQGTVRFYLTVSDALDRSSTASSQAGVYNVAPPAPLVIIEEVGIHFVRVRVLPAEPGPVEVPVTLANIFGPGGEVFEPLPFVHTFSGLTQATSYAFAARLMTPSGFKGAQSETVTASTLVDPNYVPPELPGYTGGPFLPRIQALLTEPVRHFVLQMFVDTRLRAPTAAQLVSAPPGFDAVLELFTAVGPFLGDILRRETADEETHQAALLIDALADPLAKCAVLCERVEFGFIFNQG
jgi:hypothetical protein